MGVNISIVSNKFYNQFKNNFDFSTNLTDYTTNLAGVVMEKIKVIRQLDVDWRSDSSKANSFTSSGTATKLTRVNGSFIDDGFSIGDHVAMTYIDSTGAWHGTYEFDILSINDLVMTTTTIQIPSGAVLVDGAYTIMTLYGRTPLTALIYSFGLIENSENFNIVSKVSGNDQSYYGSSIGYDTGGGVRSTSWVNLSTLGTYQDWVTGTARIRYLNNPDANTQRFEIEHTFIINPYYLEGELTNLQNNLIPTLLNGLNSLKYSFKSEFRTVLSNPNTSKIFIEEQQLGSVGWFGENFNGFNNDYSIVAIAYQDTLTTAVSNGLLIADKTTVTIQVAKASGSISSSERFGVYCSFLPPASEYQDKTTTLVANFMYDVATNTVGAASVSGLDYIRNVSATSVFGGDITITFDVQFSSTQAALIMSHFLNGDANYLIGVEIGQSSLTNGNSDRVNLLADVNTFDESADISGLVTGFNMSFIPYNYITTDGLSYSFLNIWNEHNFFIQGSFTLELLALSAVLNSFKISVIARDINGNEFELDSYDFNFPNTTVLISGDYYQLVDFETTRNYPLITGDEKNIVKMWIDPTTLVAGKKPVYKFQLGQKVSWEDWISNLNVDTNFIDTTKTENNRNFKTSNYSNQLNYDIYVKCSMNVYGVSSNGNSGNTDYIYRSPKFSIYDYDKDKNVTPNFTQVVETFDVTGTTNLGGKILVGQDTLFKITWTQASADILDISGYWAVHRIEETFETSKNLHELGTVRTAMSNNILKPITGSFLTKTLVGGKLETTCLIDGSQVVAGKNYNLSGEINDLNTLG